MAQSFRNVRYVCSVYKILTPCAFIYSFLVLIIAICGPKYLLDEPNGVDIFAQSPPQVVDLAFQAGIEDAKPILKEALLEMPEFHSAYLRRNYSEFESIFFAWLSARFLLKHRGNYHFKDLVDTVSDGEIYASCAVVGDGVLLGEFGEAIDSHDAVIRIDNPAFSMSQRVGNKSTLLLIEGKTLRLCTGISRSPERFGVNTVIVAYIRDLNDLFYVPGCKINQVVITHPKFDMLCYKIAKYYSLKWWYQRGSNVEEWKRYYGGNFRCSSRLQSVLMASAICRNVSLYGFNDAWTSDVYDYEAEMNFYNVLANLSTSDIPFLYDLDKADLPPVMIQRDWKNHHSTPMQAG